MPTENRSSSDPGTRTFTLDSLTAALEQVQAFHEISADLIAESIFSQPAQHGQGSPILLPEGYMLVERSIWTEQQIEAALAGIALVRSTPGTTDRDLALAAIDGAQCKAPQVHLRDLVQAQQNQDEPVALAIPDECPHLIVFDDTEVESLMFAGAGARSAALESWETISTSWNAHLFVRVARNSRDDRHPCATITDPAEVELLRQRMLAYEGIAESHADACAAALAKLAEAQALLRDWVKSDDDMGKECSIEGTKDACYRYDDALARAKSLLSASVELSATESDFSKQKHDAWRRAFYGEESTEPSALDEQDSGKFPVGTMARGQAQAAELNRRWAEPSAPVEIDEPVCRGAWQLGTACGKCRRCKENPPT